MMVVSIKTKIITLIKRHRLLYVIFYVVASSFINLLKLFVKADDKLILFVSSGGRRYTDSPKAIFEYMRIDERFRDYIFVWAFVNPAEFPEIENKVKIDTIKYFIITLKARCWVTNVNIQRGLSYKGKRTFFLYTGHGSPIKKCGSAVKNKTTFRSIGKSSSDACLAQSDFEMEIRGRHRSYLTGTPTNDILANYNEEYRRKIRKELGIKDGKKAILYAPTFREYKSGDSYEMPQVDFEKWHEWLGDSFVILYRAHPVAKSSIIKNGDWFVDVSNESDIEPLMIASDMLISDYSGLITDYSIMHKPIYLWTYDYEQYDKFRGLYFDVRKVLPSTEKEEKLLSMIKEGYSKEQNEMLYRFQQEYATIYGSATRNAVDLIFNKIS